MALPMELLWKILGFHHFFVNKILLYMFLMLQKKTYFLLHQPDY